MKKSTIFKSFLFLLVAFDIILRIYALRQKKPLEIYWHLNTKEKIVALTFDDGPDPRFTPEILDILKKNKIKATFFDVGNKMKLYPQIVKRQVKEGHLIGNHTYTHPDLIVEDEKTVYKELEETEKIIEKETGYRTYLFRPPKGLLDSNIFKAVQQFGYKIILWGIGVENHSLKTPQELASRVISNTYPGTIILAHDGRLNRTKTVAAVKIIISQLKKKGYKFVTLKEMFVK